jgi:hypothetical protein
MCIRKEQGCVQVIARQLGKAKVATVVTMKFKDGGDDGAFLFALEDGRARSLQKKRASEASTQ